MFFSVAGPGTAADVLMGGDSCTASAAAPQAGSQPNYQPNVAITPARGMVGSAAPHTELYTHRLAAASDMLAYCGKSASHSPSLRRRALNLFIFCVFRCYFCIVVQLICDQAFSLASEHCDRRQFVTLMDHTHVF